jgi:nucleoid DNA-binding protein
MENSNLSLKDSIIKKIVIEQAVPMNVVVAVIDHQFSSVIEALSKYNVVEVARLGKYILRDSHIIRALKGMRTMKRIYLKTIDDEKVLLSRREDAKEKLVLTLDNIEYLEGRLSAEGVEKNNKLKAEGK